MMSTIIKKENYMLNDFHNFINEGFNYTLEQNIVDLISRLSKEVGSPDYIKTPIFTKKDNVINGNGSKKKKYNKDFDKLNDVDMETIRSFQATKIEEKKGLDAKIDNVRSFLNKITDKNYNDFKDKIINIVDEILTEFDSNDDISRISNVVFEIASTNRFFSKIYADLYCELISKYDCFNDVFELSFDGFCQLFNKIEYVDPKVDYDLFCKNNKVNERRRSLSMFFVNLMNNNIINKDKIVNITHVLLCQINFLLAQENKKNEVDEITENVALLYNKKLYDDSVSYELIDGMTIPELISKLSKSKLSDYKSITNKSIFRFMDMM